MLSKDSWLVIGITFVQDKTGRRMHSAAPTRLLLDVRRTAWKRRLPAGRDIAAIVGKRAGDFALFLQEGSRCRHCLDRAAAEQIGSGLFFQRREDIALQKCWYFILLGTGQTRDLLGFRRGCVPGIRIGAIGGGRVTVTFTKVATRSGCFSAKDLLTIQAFEGRTTQFATSADVARTVPTS